MHAPIQGMTDKDIAEKLLAYMKKNGPYRAKAMFKNARVPYARAMIALEAMESEGIVEQIPDGTHRALEVVAWAVVGAARPNKIAPEDRVSFGGGQALLAMQAIARSRLMECRA